MGNSRWMSILLIILGASSYGMLSPFIKLAYGAGYNDVQITAAQVTMGTVIMWMLVLVTPAARVNPFSGPWVKLGLVGVFGLAATTLLYNKALSSLDASLSIVLLFQFTWITILMECIAQKRKPAPFQTAAILIVMLGTVLAVNLSGADWSRFNVIGLLFGLGSAFTYSLFIFSAGRIHTDFHPFMKSAQMLTPGLLAVYALYPPVFITEPGLGSLIWWGLLLGLLGQVFPTVFFLIGIRKTGAALAAMLGSMELPVGIVGAFLILGEQVVSLQWLGMLLILGGIAISEIRR